MLFASAEKTSGPIFYALSLKKSKSYNAKTNRQFLVIMQQSRSHSTNVVREIHQ